MDAGSAVLTRVHQFDALRGFAVLMILFANIFAFGYPLEMAENAALSANMTQLSQLQHQLYVLFIRGKFICLLTLVFGASLYLLWQHSQHSLLKVKSRMYALLIFGFCHSVFVWSGDVLLIYAVVGAVLLLQQVFSWSPEQQLRYAKAYLVAGLVLPSLVWMFASEPRLAADTEQLIALYTGPYADQLWMQLSYTALVGLDLVFISYWWFGGMMLLAIWGLQSDWQQQLLAYTPALLAAAFSTGLLSLFWTDFSSTTRLPVPLQFVSDLCFALLYIRCFMSLYAALPSISVVLVRCGRCALSLYLWQSICMIVLFRWLCPAWFAVLDRSQLTLIALVTVALQLVVVQRFYHAGSLWWFERLYRALSFAIEKRVVLRAR